MNKLAQRLTKSLKAPAAVQPIPYFAAYHLSAATLPPKALEALDGLLLGHMVRADDGSCRLFTYWSTAEHFNCGDAALRQRLAAQPLSGHGRIDSLCTPPVAWWQQIKPGTLILSAAALFGALEVLGNRYDRAFAEPVLLLKPEKSKLEVIDGTDLSSTVTVTNQLPGTEHRNVRVTALLEDKQGRPFPLRLVEGDIPVLAGGASKEVAIEGTAPTAGDYRLKLEATADAGWFRRSRAFSANARLVVWPRNPTGTWRKVEPNDTWARFSGSVAVGQAAPNGLDCELEIQGTPNLRYENQFGASVMHRAMKWHTAGAMNNAVALLTWSMDAVNSQSTIAVELNLMGEPGTDWPSIARKSKLSCQHRKEKLDETTS